MQIAITGATGFVGQQLIRAAVLRGHEIVAFTRDPSREVEECIETRRFSLAEPPDLSGCEAVVHLAGESILGLWTGAKMRRIRESRTLGTQRIVEAIAALAEPPEVFVCASAIGYYGDRGEEQLTELSPPGTGFLAETCVAWENAAQRAESHCRVVRARSGLVLGMGGGALPMLRRLFRLALGAQLGHGRQWMSWIHTLDLARLLLFAVEDLDVRGPLNATAPWPVRNADFTRALALSLHRPALLRVPAFALRLLLRGFADELLHSKRVLPAAAIEHGFGFRCGKIAEGLMVD